MQYCRDEPDDNITDSKSFKCKSSITSKTNNNGIENSCTMKVFK